MYRCLRLGKLFRRFIETGLLIGFFVIGSRISLAAAEKSREAPISLPVIMYHSVCEKTPADYIVSPSQLDADLEWLKGHGFTAVSAQQLIDYTNGKGSLPKKPVLITFDDGFYNNLSIALPLLEKHDMCAVVSIVGRYTDDYAAADPHADCYSYLTWADISELAASGRVEIGSHTYDMHSRSGLRQGCAKLPTDIGLLKTELHDNCGIVPAVFAYPFGALSKESLPVLRDSGILMTLTCREGMNTITREPDCLYGIFRYNRSGLLTTEEYMERITKELPV